MTKNIISENTVTLISDYLTQFLLISNKNPFLKHQILNTDVKKSLEILIKRLLRNTEKRSVGMKYSYCLWKIRTFYLICKHSPKKPITKTKLRTKFDNDELFFWYG